MIFLELFIRFFFVGLFAVGGGLATLPFLSDIAETTGWFTQMDISNMIAISESTPGPIGINMATYVGFQTGSEFGFAGGILGAVMAPFGLTAPALIIVIAVSKVLQRFRSSKYVEWVFYGLRAASLGLIASACLGVVKIAFFSADAFSGGADFFAAVDYKSIILSALIFIGVTKFKKIHPIVFIIAAAVVGVVLKF